MKKIKKIIVLVIISFLIISCADDKHLCEGIFYNMQYDVDVIICEKGFWIIDNQNTNIRATDPCTAPILDINACGYWAVNNVVTNIIALRISKDGYWIIGDNETHVLADLSRKPDLSVSDDGYWLIDSEKTDVRADCSRPIPRPNLTISDDGYWVVNGQKTNVIASDEPSSDEPEITVSDDGNWVINGNKTDVCAINCENVINKIFTVMVLPENCRWIEWIDDDGKVQKHEICGDSIIFEVQYGNYIDSIPAEPVNIFKLEDVKVAGLYVLNNESQPYLRFEGWYSDNDTANEFNFNIPIRQDYVVRARWSALPIPVASVNPHNYNDVNAYINVPNPDPADTTMRRYALLLTDNFVLPVRDFLTVSYIDLKIFGIANTYRYFTFTRNLNVSAENLINCRLTIGGRLRMEHINYGVDFPFVSEGWLNVNRKSGLTISSGAVINARVNVHEATFTIGGESYVRFLYIGDDSVVVISGNAIIGHIVHNSMPPFPF
jgi:uncharacterized repeat protein (TIGR02543 family)